MILKTVRETIDRHDLIADGRKVLVAVSGGVDSVVLAHLLSRLAAKRFWDLSIGHINHGLRGEESDEDEHFVRKFSKKLGISCCVGRIDPRDWTPGANRQEQARELRYRLLQAFAGEGDAILATAHHADDQAETVLERLLRGAGVDGLSGMAMKRENIVRPLLGVSRPEILTYAGDGNWNGVRIPATKISNILGIVTENGFFPYWKWKRPERRGRSPVRRGCSGIQGRRWSLRPGNAWTGG